MDKNFTLGHYSWGSHGLIKHGPAFLFFLKAVTLLSPWEEFETGWGAITTAPGQGQLFLNGGTDSVEVRRQFIFQLATDATPSVPEINAASGGDVYRSFSVQLVSVSLCIIRSFFTLSLFAPTCSRKVMRNLIKIG